MKVFFIGICGISMSALAYLTKLEGDFVKGSDINFFNIPKCLDKISIYKQPYIEGIDWADLIVCSSAIKDNTELQMAKKLGKKVLTRGEWLGVLAKKYQKVIAVAGSHGKTTTTAMIYNILKVTGKNPTLHLGGNLKGVGNVISGGKGYFVTEACEYYDNFLHLKPYMSVITNIEPEHLDYFKTFENEKKSFEKFKQNSKFVVEKSEYSAKNIYINKDGKIAFNLFKNNQKIDRIKLKIGGKYNAKNALYAMTLCEKLGISHDLIKLGLESFEGVKKRCERVENNFNFLTFVDYAHHPKEILESAKYFKKIARKKCVAIFQPHTYSRTQKFFDGFLSSLSLFDEIICFKTYSAREREDEGLNETDIFNGLLKIGKTAFVCYDINELKIVLKRYEKGDLVVFLGAGDLPDKFDFMGNLT